MFPPSTSSSRTFRPNSTGLPASNRGMAWVCGSITATSPVSFEDAEAVREHERSFERVVNGPNDWGC